jgi:hypothetical protein
VGAIHPVAMRHHRVKATRGAILKAPLLLARVMKQLGLPAAPLAENALACRSSQGIAG